MRAQPYRSLRTEPAVDAAVAKYGSAAGAALPVLRDTQTAHGSLEPTALGAVADILHENDARIYGVASFYSMLSMRPRPTNVLRVCDGPVCMLKGADSVRKALVTAASAQEWAIERSSCLGVCDCAPAALRNAKPCGPLQADSVADTLEGQSTGIPSYALARPGEVRVAMARIGRIDPESIESAIDAGAYQALDVALAGDPTAVLDVVDAAGLRGCGGAGFPTGSKWRMVANAGGSSKYVVCNADESEPGTFKDRVLMEGDPHLILESMALAGYAVGAREGIIYIRGEYEWIAQLLERAIAQAEAHGWLGRNIRGSSFSFRVHVHRGAGAYICGEETALLESLEGRRGEPRIRPPYPTTHGLHGRPTVVNNVETLCYVPAIVSLGPEWFRSMGTSQSPGTKMFTVTGCIRQPGAFEAPLGITLRQIIEQFGGGLRDGSTFKAALTGGAAGTFVPASMLDVPLDFASSRHGPALGSGAMIILDDRVSIPTVLTWLLKFFEVESCGKCAPCREGTREARLICERIADGQGRPDETTELRRLSHMLELTSLCGLGRSVAWPIESALQHFGEEFTAQRE